MFRFVTVGEFKSEEYFSLFSNYLKLTSKFCKVSHDSLKVKHSTDDFQKLQSEVFLKFYDKHKAQRIFLIILDEKGKLFKSTEFAQKIEKARQEFSEIWLVAAGQHGFDTSVLEKAKLVLSLSPFTFAHELACVVSAEQVFRAFSIINNHPYHNE